MLTLSQQFLSVSSFSPCSVGQTHMQNVRWSVAEPQRGNKECKLSTEIWLQSAVKLLWSESEKGLSENFATGDN